jgi:hypothetical protein
VEQQERIPAASIAEVERFWADGENVIQSSTGADLQPETSSTIDMPGVGTVPLDQASPGTWTSGRVSAGDGVEVVRPPHPVAGVEPIREISLRDRFVASIKQTEGDRLDIVITPRGVAMLEELAEPGRLLEFRASLKVGEATEEFTPNYRALAKKLLAALYGMIGHFGMPIQSRELADEVETALLHAEAAKVDEVLL